jgi:hypothetical protein
MAFQSETALTPPSSTSAYVTSQTSRKRFPNPKLPGMGHYHRTSLIPPHQRPPRLPRQSQSYRRRPTPPTSFLDPTTAPSARNTPTASAPAPQHKNTVGWDGPQYRRIAYAFPTAIRSPAAPATSKLVSTLGSQHRHHRQLPRSSPPQRPASNRRYTHRHILKKWWRLTSLRL